MLTQYIEHGITELVNLEIFQQIDQGHLGNIDKLQKLMHGY
jgi:hypothetical protein